MIVRRRVRGTRLAALVLLAGAASLAGACGRTAQPQTAAPNAPGDSIVPRGPTGLAAAEFPTPARPVSSIVSPRWASEESRDDAGEAGRVLDATGIRAGMTVADVGAGDGYYTVRAADRVGPSGRVYAEDIEEKYLRLLQGRLRTTPRPNVMLALGDPHDPRLPPASLDAVLMMHMYHEVTQPYALLYNLYPALRPGARIAIVDQEALTSAHGTLLVLLQCELEAVGYRLQRTEPMGGGAYLALFTPPPVRDSLTSPAHIGAELHRRGCRPDSEPR